jgi:hypothetical protein
MKRMTALLAAMLVTANAQAAPRKIDDCEAIQEPMAYNACLASFGPTRGHSSATAAIGHEAPRAHSLRGRPGAAEAAIRRDRGGRVHMEFTTRHGW